MTKKKAPVELMKAGAPKKLVKRLERTGQTGTLLSIVPSKLGGVSVLIEIVS